MDQIIITKPDASTWALVTKSNVTAVTRAEQKRTLLGEDVVTMTVESAVTLPFAIRDRITIFGYKYFLNNLEKPTKNGKRKFVYELTWEGRQYDLLKPLYLDKGLDGVSISPDFPLTGNLEFFMDVLITNANSVLGSGTWALGDCPETDYRTLAFSNENCLGVLQRLCKQDAFNKEFEIVENAGVCTINIKDAIGTTHPTTYEYGKGKGLWSLTRETVSEKNIITRLYVFGANKNLPWNYRGYSQRLKLPLVDLSYIEDAGAIATYGLIEGVKIFNEIFPHRTGIVSGLGSTVDEFLDSSMDFDLEAVDGEGNTLYLIDDVKAKLHFNTGNLAGYEFEILYYDHDLKKFKILGFSDERGQVFPDPDTSAFQIAVGDKYVIDDITMPQSYVDTAEAALDAAGDAWYALVSQPRVQYSQTFDELYFKNKYAGQSIQNVFGIGDNVPIEDSDIGVDKLIRLRSFRRDVIYPYRYNLDLYDFSEETLAAKLVASSSETSKVITMNNLDDSTKKDKSAAEFLNLLLQYMVIVNPGTSNAYFLINLPLASVGNIQAGSDPGSMPPLWNAIWGQITGTLANQTDLANALAGKADLEGGVVSQTHGGTGLTSLFQLFKMFIDTRHEERNLETMFRPVLIRNAERINYPWPASETKWKVIAHDTVNKIITLDNDLPIEILDYGTEAGRRWQLQNSTTAGGNVQITNVDFGNEKIYYSTLRGTFAVDDYVCFWNPFRNFVLNPLSYVIGTNSWATTYISPGGLWKHSDGDYRMIVNGWDGSHGMTGLYKSSDLVTWTAVSGSYYYHAGVHPFDEAWCIGGATHWTASSPIKIKGSSNYAKAFQGLNAAGRGEVGIVQFDEDFAITSMPTAGISVPGYVLDSNHHYYPGGLAYFNDNLYLSMRYRNTTTGVDKILIMKYDIATNICTDVEEVCDNETNAYTELTAQHSCPFVFNSELFVLVGGENSTATPPIGVTNEIYGFFHKRYGSWQPYTQNPFIANPMYGENVYSGCDWAIDHMGASPCLIQRGNYLHLFVAMNAGTDTYKVAKMDMLLPL